MEMCSKPLSIFVHGFNLLFLFWFINCRIRCAWRLCYCCCPLAVCLDQLWLILPRVDWTLQMSAYNLLIPFISGLLLLACVCARASVCVCEGVFVKDRWGWVVVSMCWKWVDLIYTGLFAQLSEGRGGGVGWVGARVLVASPFHSSVALSLVFSHICSWCSVIIALSLICLALLPTSSSASHFCIITLLVCQSPAAYLFTPHVHLWLSFFFFLLSFCLFLFHQHSLRIPFNLLFTHSFHVFTLAPSPSLPDSLIVCQC